METLLEDYKRRLKSVTELIEKTRSNGSIVHQRREERLKTKAAEYRTFIVEIERAHYDEIAKKIVGYTVCYAM